MPTMSYYRLVVDGSEQGVVAFRGDDRVWAVEPWLGFFGGATLEDDGAHSGRVVYLWADDYKRPGPDVARIAAAYPDLEFMLEWSDEFGQMAGRARFTNGAQVDAREVDPLELGWMDWEVDDEGD